jgi:hypothetical protein
MLRLVSYFSPLLSVARDVAVRFDFNYNHLSNMLKLAPPLVVPWTDVAVHIAHKQVG